MHRCRRPYAHRLLAGGAVVLWISVFAVWLVPKAVYHLTHSGAWALGSIGLALTAGLLIVKGLADWCCQPLWQTWGLPSLKHLALMAWALREER
jgi:hypothetical protein